MISPRKILFWSLLVDDEPSLAKLGARLLERNGYQVTSLTNPEEALEIIKKDPFRFQLVISDQLMPQMTGDKLLDSILEINPDVKTIICSGNIDKVDQNIVEKVGVEFVLKKP
ncbi:MAG: CheY-like chemotaxis protein [Desulforhopalus sp.]|jgi:CheY-like chemotaxis protein